METEELIKLVDGIYKNILDKFNPGARQMINAGKAYLKALHGAAAASRLYVDAITKLARQAQQGTWGGSSDIGTALMKIVEVYKDIQEQQMNILKAFYVDLLVPLETNLEKDTKVVQSEQKRFLQQHKTRSESYTKAAAVIKKQRKKARAVAGNKAALAMDKELKNMQVLEEEKSKLDSFCEQSLKNAMTQERRRYGFVLERQCSLAKHYLAYHNHSMTVYQQNVDDWTEVAKTREYLPEAVESMFTNRMRQVSFWPDEDVYSSPRSPQLDDDRLSISSQLRKTKSMDASCLDIRSIGDVASPMLSLSRAKSEFNLTASTHSLAQDCNTPQRRPKSMAVPSTQAPQWETQLARALYAYLSSGDNQLSFLEGDVIALIGDRNKGWQYGENLRTQCSGWFPLAYTEIITDDSVLSSSQRTVDMNTNTTNSAAVTPATPTGGGLLPGGSPANSLERSSKQSTENPPHSTIQQSTTRMFGDTLNLHRSMANAKQLRRVTGSHGNFHHHHGPPPALPAPIPTPTLPFPKSSSSSMPHSQSTSFTQTSDSSYAASSPYGVPNQSSSTNATATMMKTSTSYNFATPATGHYSTHPQGVRTIEKAPPMPPLPSHIQSKSGKIGPAIGNVSLHSSNDSGFSNDPPPQPEVDYSDDDSAAPNSSTRVPIRTSQRIRKLNSDNNNNTKENGLNGTLQNGSHSLRPSNSVGTLTDNRSFDQDFLLRSMRVPNGEKRSFVKRTKSFWRFGKSSDSDILEGMALWKHRDLVDVTTETTKNEKNKQNDLREQQKKNELNKMTTRSGGSNNSNDSDRTLQNQTNDEAIYGETVTIPKEKSYEVHKNTSKKSSKNSEKLNSSIEEQKSQDSDFENHFDVPGTGDQFFVDGGDGLLLRVKTVNRKNILQQYDNDLTGSEESGGEETDSILTSDDPYDCIVIDDHTTSKERSKKGLNHPQNGLDTKEKPKTNKVVEIGKKLEKLAKKTKYSPNSPKETTETRRISNETNTQIVPDRRNLPESHTEYTFRTFGYETETLEKRDSVDKIRYYSERENGTHDIQDKPYAENLENRQFIPRTKLVKSNSVSTGNSKFEQESGLLEYGQTLQKRMKEPEHGSKFDEISPKTGNIYGPWYDLWGIDESVKRPEDMRNIHAQEIYNNKF